MEYRRLRLFLALAEELHFRRAAERCGVTPSVLSDQIRRLEDELGGALFARSTRAVALTPLGTAFRVEAGAALRRLEEATLTARHFVAGAERALRVAMTTAFGFSPATTGLARFRDVHPAVKLFVREMGTVDAQDALGREEVDLALLHPPLDRVDLSLSPLGVEPLDALYRADLYSVPNNPALADVLAHPLIWYPYSRAPRVTTRFLALASAAGRAPDIAAEAESSLAAIAMAAAGLGIALVPRSFSQIEAPGCVLRPLAGGPLYLERAVAVRTRDEADPVLNTLVDCLRDAFGVSADAAKAPPEAATNPPPAPQSAYAPSAPQSAG